MSEYWSKLTSLLGLALMLFLALTPLTEVRASSGSSSFAIDLKDWRGIHSEEVILLFRDPGKKPGRILAYTQTLKNDFDAKAFAENFREYSEWNGILLERYGYLHRYPEQAQGSVRIEQRHNHYHQLDS